MIRPSRLLQGAVVAVLMLAIAGCGSEEGFTTIEIPSGFIRSVNAISDSPTLTVDVGTQSTQRVPFAQSSDFVASLPDLTLQMNVSYEAPNQEQVTLFEQEPVLVGVEDELTVVLAGTLDSPQIIRLLNPPQTDIDTTTELELQFVHAATQSDNPVTLTLLQDGSVVFETTLAYGDHTPLEIVEAGDYRLEARDNATQNLLWDSGSFSLSAGTRGLIMLADYFGPGDSDVRGLSVGEQGTTPFANEQFPAALRYANLTATQGPLTLTVRGETFIENVDFRTVTDYLPVDTGAAGIEVSVFGEPGNVLFESDSFDFLSGNFLTFVTTGTGETAPARIFGNDRRRIPTRAVLNVVNAAPSVGTVDIYVVDSGTSIENINPRGRIPTIPENSAAQSLELVAGNYDFVVADEGTKDVLAGPLGLDFVGGGLYTIYISDAAGGGEPIELVLADDLAP